MRTKKEFTIDGLDCASCAVKIEDNIKKIKGVATAAMNFATQTLVIESESDQEIDDVIAKSHLVIKQLEPHVVIKEKVFSKPERKVLFLLGLDCADCALKIEKEVANIDGVKSAHVDFILKKLTIDVVNMHHTGLIVEKATQIAHNIESGLSIVEEDKKNEDEHDHRHEGINQLKLIRISIGAILFFVALILQLPFVVELGMYLVSYGLVGGEVVLRAIKNISRGQIFDENFLMSLATIGAFAIKEFPEAVAVMLFYQIGEIFQGIAVNRSRKSIAALMDIRPDYANLKIGEQMEKVAPEVVGVGSIIIVKPGEKIPLDGKVVFGKSMLDTSALTGESIPREVEAGNDVLSGSINKNGLLEIEVTKIFGDSTVSKILDLVQNASSKKAPTENFITKFAKYYTPVVVFAAVALAFIPPLLITGATFSEWINRALVFLVVSCPCALVISIPLGFFGGIGGASKKGILVKGSNYLEALNSVDTVVFDKTGTLTKGVFKVTEIKTTHEITEAELLEYAAFAESYSNHPIALSILKAYGKEINNNEISNYDEISGHGIIVSIRGKTILVGNSKLLIKENIIFNAVDAVGTIVYVAINGVFAGYIMISDEVKKDSLTALAALKNIGVKRLVMLTGDSKTVAEKIGKDLGLDEVYAELLPDQKVEKLEMLDKKKLSKGKLLFVGDGINDAPVLARADVGVAMGGLGSDAAIEAADIVLMTDEISKIVDAIKIAKRTRRIIWQNIFFAMSIKGIVLLLGAGGLATIWEAVFADVGVTLIAIINSMRVINSK